MLKSKELHGKKNESMTEYRKFIKPKSEINLSIVFSACGTRHDALLNTKSCFINPSFLFVVETSV